ncbi:MAG: thiolase family protein [Thermoproteota archaeon]
MIFEGLVALRSNSNREVYIVSAVRTPIGKFGRSLHLLDAVDLGAIAIRAAIEKAGISPKDVEFVAMGHVIRAGTGQATARQAAIKAGIPISVDAMNVDMVCSSGMAAVMTAATMIRAGEVDLVVAGGMESMSRAPFIIPAEARWGIRHLITRSMNLVDAMYNDGLFDHIAGMGMGEEADKVAKEHGYTREELDQVALESHRRAAKAQDSGLVDDELVIVNTVKDGVRVYLDRDEGVRRDITPERLAKLPPAFGRDGLHTAGNSSQLSDGAAALVLASKEKVRELGLKPIARILGYSWSAVETWRFTEAPIKAVKRLLAKLNMQLSDFDYFENNEAFAVSSLLFRDMLNVSLDRVNVFGGAIALGHPLGATGARIIVTLLNVLRKKGGRRGIAALCHGLGGATAIAVELV